MKVHHFAGQTSKHRSSLRSHAQLLLLVFALLLLPFCRGSIPADTANLDTRATTTANVETTAELVETRVVGATPASRSDC